ncbi:MAG: DNA repair exonuclease [Acidobacteriota bacterium]
MSSRRILRFVHCADLHLDSPFEGLATVDPEIAETLRASTFQAFERVVDLAIREEADFLIVAGDVYDSASSSLAAQLRFRAGLERVTDEGIRCFVAHGNHDPLSGWDAGLALPPGAHRFGGDRIERVLVRRRGEDLAAVYGISYAQRVVEENLAQRFAASGDTFSIGVLHCEVVEGQTASPYAPCSFTDLERSGVDYWALGHSHAPRVLGDEHPTVVYAGTPQGRHPREIGPHGCFLVDVEALEEGGYRTHPRFVATDVVRWSRALLDIAEVPDLERLLDKIHQVIAGERERSREPDGRPRPTVLRLELIGRGPLHKLLQQIDAERDLAQPLRRGEKDRDDQVWIESVRIASRPALDAAELRRQESSLGDFLRATDRLREQTAPAEEIRQRLGRRGEFARLAAIVRTMEDHELLALIDEAEALGLDLLADGGETPT